MKVRIDAGHSPSCVNGGKSGYKEHLGMWKLSNYLKEILESYGVQADLTRTYDADPELYDRGRMAQDYDLFISEHSNAGGGKGVEVIRDFSKPYDEVFAKELTDSVARVMNTISRKVLTRTYVRGKKNYNYYGVIRGASATNCRHIFIIENGFHDNATEEVFLKNDENLKKIAQVQAEVICKYLGVTINNIEMYKNFVQAQTGIDNNTMNFLSQHPYSDALFTKLYNSMITKKYKSQYLGMEITKDKAYDIVQKSTGFDLNTMNYLKSYTWGNELLQKLAKIMI